MARVLVWQSQLAANDFPPVCAMTGLPVETWRKFSFSSAPPYAFWFGGLLMAAIMARRASGYLPLTRASVKKLRLTTWGIFGFIPVAFLLWIVAAVVGSAAGSEPVGSSVTVLLIVLGAAFLMVGVVGLLIARRTLGPTGKVLEPQSGHNESLVELNNVHPAFVAAVQRLQQMRAEQSYGAPHPLPAKWQ